MSIEKLIKYTSATNIAEMLEDEQLHDIVQDASKGFDIDEESCESWVKMNKDAIKMIKAEVDAEVTKNYAHSKVIYPLLASATIQLASRLMPHLTRNNKVVECAVLGPDPQGLKQEKANQVSNFFSYDLLIESDTWLNESQKLIQMVCAWGTGYRKLYYSADTDKVASEVISPEDVIINSNTISLDKCRRLTIRHYMTANNIIEQIRADQFLDINPKELKICDEEEGDDSNPVYEILEQFCYLDLDEDGYEEPYTVFFSKDANKVLGIQAAYDVEDIHVKEDGTIKKIVPKPYIIDYHCIDDPEGKFHSMGLNHLLFHQNKSITSILRQLIDSGTLANQQGGFVTKAFKTKKRDIKQELGKFTQLEIPPSTDIRTQIMPLPFKEPSQVLFSLLGLLIEAGKETGFVTQTLMGDAATQNVPATTMLAMIEQGTRAFKPMVQKLFSSLKKEFKLMFKLYGQYSQQERFIKFYDTNIVVGKETFNADELDIMPVADPTQSSEAHKYMKMQALQQLMQTPLANVLNPHQMAIRMFKDLQIEKPEQLIMPPQPQQPDPQAMKVQMDHQIKLAKLELERIAQDREQAKLELEMLKTKIKENEYLMKQEESDEKQRMMLAKAHKDQQEANVKERLAQIAEDKVEVERERLRLMTQQQDKDS